MNEPQLIPVYEWKSNHSPAGADLMIIEEPELRAFIRAVTELFGPEQARIAAEDSVDEMELVDTITWTDQARSGLGPDSCLGPACEAAEYRCGPSTVARCLNRYQSITDTFVQLFRPGWCGLIASRGWDPNESRI